VVKAYKIVIAICLWLKLVLNNHQPNLHYTRLITPKRVTSWRCPSPRHSVKATQLPS